MSRSMNKSQLSQALFDELRDRPGMTRAFAAEIIETIFGVVQRNDGNKNKSSQKRDGIIAKHLLSGDSSKVTLPGFGTLRIVFRKGRSGRLPSTGETISIPPTHVVTFRPGKALRIAASKEI